MSNEQLAETIYNDGIDILVDGLGLPSARWRLLAMAYKPAPIQIHFPSMGSLGMRAIDYHIVDEFAAPLGMEDNFSEKLIRVPLAYHFSPSIFNDDINHSPDSSLIRFGSFNNVARINSSVLQYLG